MTHALRIDEKDPAEIVPLSWDFTSDLTTPSDVEIIGVPVISIRVDNSLFRGSDPNVDAMLIGSPQVVENTVMQMVGGGVDRVDYAVACDVRINSTPEALFRKVSILPVRTQ